MFTGIVEERGVVVRGGVRTDVTARVVAEDSPVGASVAVNGVCLTVVARAEAADGTTVLGFDLSPETLARSTLGELGVGAHVNLERPVTPATRLGGHLVQGHVDGVGVIEDVREVETGREVTVRMPEGLGRYVVEKGSVTVEGVSLTVTAARDDAFSVALIPHTLEVTTLGERGAGDRVNLEVDVMAKYVERLLGTAR